MKNIKNFIDKEIVINNLSMKKQIRSYNDDYKYMYYDHSSEGKMFYHYLERFIKSNVGKSYNKTFSKFCEKMKNSKEFPKILWGETIQKRFESCFTGNYSRFYIENSIIKESKPRYKREIKPIIVQSYPIEYYKFPEEELQKFPWLEPIMNKTLGKDKTQHYLYDKIFPEEFENLKSLWKTEIYKLNQELLNYKYDIYNSWSFQKFLSLFKGYGIPDIVAEPGTKEFERHYYEQLDANKKWKRESQHNKKIYAENLLHEIAEKEKQRKQKEEEEDKLLKYKKGFDDNSFVGEFYHGEKRKKNKN